MSADNEICILELIDKDGNKEYRVADNVSMSYNMLRPKIDISVYWQGPMAYKIWHDAKIFYHRLDAHEYADKLEEDGYYEYGICIFSLNGNWADVVKANEENECPHCHGSGEMSVMGRTINETCSRCDGYGLREKMS